MTISVNKPEGFNFFFLNQSEAKCLGLGKWCALPPWRIFLVELYFEQFNGYQLILASASGQACDIMAKKFTNIASPIKTVVLNR